MERKVHVLRFVTAFLIVCLSINGEDPDPIDLEFGVRHWVMGFGCVLILRYLVSGYSDKNKFDFFTNPITQCLTP